MGKDSYKGNPSDIVITVLGPTGSGKTNFVNALTGGTEQHGASGLKPVTQSATPHIITYHGHRLVLVDTLGFDDASRPDKEVVRNAADWLKQKYPDNATLKASGIIYLHRITDNRVSGSVQKNLQTFARQCGNIPLHRARLVTTMWDKAKDRAVAENRETQLTGEFWRELLEEGTIAKRFDNTQTCAWDIVRELLPQEKLAELQKRPNGKDSDKPASCLDVLFSTKRT